MNDVVCMSSSHSHLHTTQHNLSPVHHTEEVQIDIEGEDVEDGMLRQLFWQEVRHYHPDLPAQPVL